MVDRDLVFEPAGSSRFGVDLERIQPPIHSSGGTVLAMRRPPMLPVLLRSLLEDLPLLAAIPLLLLGLEQSTFLVRSLACAGLGVKRSEAESFELYAEVDDSWKPDIRQVMDYYVLRTPGAFIEEKHFSNFRNSNGFYMY